MLRKTPAVGEIDIRKVCLVVFAAYLVAIGVFYFLAGDQLRYRDSVGNLPMPVSESGVGEITAQRVVEQTFTPQIQRLESVSVQWGSYYRTNAGTVTMELWNARDNMLLLSESYDAAAIEENGFLTLTAEEPIETVYGTPLLLRISGDSQPGQAASPLMAGSVQREGETLSVNGQAISGTLCFSVSGQDYVWTGLHYPLFAAIGAAVLFAALALIYYRVKTGQRSYVYNALIAMWKYGFLIRQLVNRDFKTKYKRSVLGAFWSFLNPLLTMLVQYVVFSTIFKSDIPHYPAYLLIGIVMFNFFNEACAMSLTSIVGNTTLITKVYMPKYIYPLTRVMSSVINLAISLIPMLLVTLVTGVHLHKSALLALYFFCCLIIFCLGLGLVLSTSMVFFRDTQFLWGVVSMMWVYATPIFYPETILPENLRFILLVNPMYHFLKYSRVCILNGISPEPRAYALCFVLAVGMLAVGALVFRKEQDRFILYL